MENLSVVFIHWRGSLLRFHDWFEGRRASTRNFRLTTFLFFVALNLGCYWWALLTTYPQFLVGPKADEYVLMGFPVAVLGALFDSLSLLVTLYIVRRALSSTSNLSYLGYLSVDLVIAVLATFWVLFAFMVSGWVVSLILALPETFEARTALYQGRLWSVFNDPFNADNLRNIYFGMVMGASALLPTLFHLFLAGKSLVRSIGGKVGIAPSQQQQSD